MVPNGRIFFLAMTQVVVVVVVLVAVLIVARGADARQPLYRHVLPMMGRMGTRRSSITSRRYYPHSQHPPNDDLTVAGNLLSSTIDAVIRTRTKTTRGRTATTDTTASQQQEESSASATAKAAAAGDTQHLLAAEQSPASSTSDPDNDTAEDDSSSSSSSSSSMIIKKSFLSHIRTTTITTTILPKSLLLVSKWALGIGAVGAVAWGLHWLVVTKMGWINKIDNNNNNNKNPISEFFQLRSVPLDDWILMCRWEMPSYWNQNFASHFNDNDDNDGGANSDFNQTKLKMAVRPYMKERLRKTRKVTAILDQKEKQEQKKGGGDGEGWTEEEATTVAEFYASVTAERLVGVVEALERRLLLVEPQQQAKKNNHKTTGENDSTARRQRQQRRRRRQVSREQLVARLAGRIRQGILLMNGHDGGDLNLALLFSESTLREFFKDSLRESIYYCSSSTEEEEEVVSRGTEDDEDNDDDDDGSAASIIIIPEEAR